MTLDQIRKAIPGEVLWDGHVKGLHLRVSISGTKGFFFYYRTKDGRQRRPKLGTLGEITLADARKRAKKLSDKVATGEDPKGQWDEKRAEMTVAELFEKVWDEYWDSPRFEKSGWRRQVKNIYDRFVGPSFGKERLSEVTPPRIREWHNSYKKSPYSANRALTVLSRMFRFAEEQEFRSQNSNPCNLVKPFPEKKRKRFATEEEIRKIAPLIEKYTSIHPHGVAFLLLLMWTGSRPRAIERATWDQVKEFDVNGQPYGVLTFKGKSSEKTGEEERVILPPQAMRALNRLPRIEGETITGVKMPRRLWLKIKQEAGCEDLWARDWRRTFATVGMSGGIDIGVIGELLNHRSNETTKIYAKVMDTRKIEAVGAIADKIEKVMKEKMA